MYQGEKSLLVQAPCGCVAGETTIRVNRNKKGYRTTLEKEFNFKNDKRRNSNKTKIRALNSKQNAVNLSEIETINFSGVKECIQLFSKNRRIILTPEHLIFTKRGWIEAKNMLGLEFAVDNYLPQKSFIQKKKRDTEIRYLKYHPFACEIKPTRERDKNYKKIEIHRAIYEAYFNNLKFSIYINILKNNQNKATSLRFINTKTHCIHHKDGNHFNNDINNLQCLTKEVHHKLHSQKTKHNFSQGKISWEKVIKIKCVGKRKTYDIVGSKTNSFTANDIIVHNSGKTLLTAHMLRTAASRGKTAIFIVHRRELIKQSIEAFELLGIKPGVISNGWFEIPSSPVQIASIQTLSRRLTKIKKPDLVVWDEVHHIGARTWGKVYENYAKAYHIGLTATPCRMDGTGLDKWFSKMVLGPSVQWLIDNGYLSKYKMFAPSKIDTSSVHSRMGDYITSELLAIVDRPTITGDAIKHYKKLCFGKRAIVFCVSIEHSKHVVEQFNNAGIPAEHIDGETHKDMRDAAIKKFSDGKILILSNVDLVGEGFDLPAIEAGILLRPTQSLGMYIQQIGRPMRPSSGKECAYILDHAGNCQRHGLPCDDREWTLTGYKAKKKGAEGTIKIKTCPRCYAVQLPGRDKCLYCGYEFDKSPRKVDFNDGNLVEIDLVKAKKVRLTEQGKAKSFEALVNLGRQRKYKRPYLWAKHVFNARKAREQHESPLPFRAPGN